MSNQNENETKMDRREFTLKSALAALSGVVITVTACSSDGPSSPSPAPTNNAPPPAQDISGVVGSNHGHTAVITAAELTAGASLVLDIMGTSDHAHSVELTSMEVTQIASGGRVSKLSSNVQAHAHSVTFN